MQPHNSNGERATQGNTDGGRDAERSPSLAEVWLAFQKAADRINRPVHIAESGKPVNMSASIAGQGGLAA